MRSTAVFSFIIGSAVAVLIVGGLLIWYQDGSPPPPPPDSVAAPTSAPPARSGAAGKTAEGPGLAPQPAPSQTNQVGLSPAQPEPLGSEAVVAGDWDDRVAELMTSGLDDLQTSLKILEMMQKMPETNQVQAAEFLTSLMPDEGYRAIVPLVTNTATSTEVMDVLMVDLLDRPNAVQLPLLLDLARNPAHPRREEAREYLELYLDADYGNNWGAWENALKRFLAENPE